MYELGNQSKIDFTTLTVTNVINRLFLFYDLQRMTKVKYQKVQTLRHQLHHLLQRKSVRFH
jgi:hypothetical protein